MRSRGAQRAQDADLAAALRDGDHQGVLNQEQSDDQGEDAGEAGRAAVIHEHLLEIAAPLGGRIDVEAGAEGRGQGAAAIVHRNSAPRGDVDAVEFALLSENSLRRVDVHHRQAAAESLGQSSRAEQAAHGKGPGAFHRLQNQPAAHGKAVAGGKIAADHDGIRLRQEDQRIIQFRSSEVVLANALVRRHVHTQDEQVALPAPARAHHGFHHR